MDKENMSDHDLIIRVSTVVDMLQTGQDNHLEHHRRHDLVMLSVTLGSVFTSILAIATAVIAFIM